MVAFALAPASAARRTHKHGKAAVPAKHRGAARAARPAPVAAPLKAAPSGRRQDRAFDTLSGQFLNALWRSEPERAIAAGKYEFAAELGIPDAAGRARQLAFVDDWLRRFSKFNPNLLSERQRTDLALLDQRLNGERWRLTVWREFEWNPASYDIAAPIARVLRTEYASQPQRLRTLLRRIANVPAYYEAARAGIVNPTREHTRLAISRGGATLALLAELERVAQASILTPAEKQLYARRGGAARNAVEGYLAWLGELDRSMETNGGRDFRLGKELYQQKFDDELDAETGAEQLYQRALSAREQLLAEMDRLADDAWSGNMGEAAKPAGREAKIGALLARLSAQHGARTDLAPEIRRQIPLLQNWVAGHQLLALDAKQAPLVRETPAHQRDAAPFGGLDAPGPYRPQDRAHLDIAPPGDDERDGPGEYNSWNVRLLAIHEAIPGRATQRAYANRSPSIIKAVAGNPALADGWAAYSERMMLESGYGDNAPELWLTHSKRQLGRISDAILGYGAHVLGTTREQALDMLAKQAFQDPREAADTWRRVQLAPLRASAAFSGYSDIMALREQRRQALGRQFSLKRFHEQLLGHGNAPLRLIKEAM